MPALTKWDWRFLDLVKRVASWSKDPNTKMGCLIVSSDRRHVSWGYNGFPEGIADNSRLMDRDLKRQMMEHSERNCVYNCPFEPRDYNCTAYITGQPCIDCAKALMAKQIRRVVCLEHPFIERWRANMELAESMLKEVGTDITYVGHDREITDDLMGV